MRGILKAQEITLLYNGGKKHERGVGFVINNKNLPNIVNFKIISDRLCYITQK